MQASSGQLIDNTQYLTSSWKFTQRYSSFILGMGWVGIIVLNFMWTKEKIVKSLINYELYVLPLKTYL